MLHINDLTYRIEGRAIFQSATAGVPTGHKVGLVGRNGAGKTTLLRLIAGELTPDDGSITTGKRTRIGIVSQEAPGGPESLITTVLAADVERMKLLQEAQAATDPYRISEIQLRLTDIDAHSAPARAAAILAGLGFAEAAQQRPCAEYSGGWRMRVALASALFASPDVLLLDEPTNYLDLEGSLWLESFLRTYPHTVIIVSHDRDLLNTAVQSILYLAKGKLTLYAGGYDDFEEQRREKQRLDLKLMAKQDAARRHMQAFVDRFRYKASKARQAQSRVKALERMKPIAAQIDERVAPFVFPNPTKPLGNPLLRLEAASVGYGENAPVLRDLNLRIDQDDRIGLLGANGNGKSTFAKLIVGQLATQDGYRRCSKKLEFGYFAQHQLDELNPQQSPFDHIARLMDEATEAQKRAKLGSLGFGPEKADTKCADLSGGEKARLLFALAAFHGPHLLILDEPTNHLDVDSREALIHALNEYEGAVILISHDRHLIEATADRLWLVGRGTVTPYEGDLDGYRTECLAARTKGRKGTNTTAGRAKKKGNGAENSQPIANQKDQRRQAAARRQQLAPLKREIEAGERRINTLAEQIAKLDRRLADTGLYAHEPENASRLAKERGQLVKALTLAEEAWLSATEAYEEAMKEGMV